LLRVLGGALSPGRGTVELDGRRLDETNPLARARDGIVRTLQRTAVSPGLSTLEYVTAGTEPTRRAGPFRSIVHTPVARAEKIDTSARAAAALAATGLLELAGADTETLTTAEQRLLQIARALASGPRVLLLDEPAAGVDAANEERLRGVIASLRDAGFTIVIVEHNLRLVGAVADHVSVLDAGKLIASGRLDDVANDPAVREAYLGPDIMAPRAPDNSPDRARAPRRSVQRQAGAARRERGDRSQRAARKSGSRRETDRARGAARSGGDQRRRGR
jgi:branched-chain amino acid transport system ATP-binding protein